MALVKRTVSNVFHKYRDEQGRRRTAWRGDELLLTPEEAARGDALGAFEGTQADRDPVAEYLDNGTKQGGEHTTIGARSDAGGSEGVVPSELTDEQIDALTGRALDDACEMADIDTSVGGSLADGSLSADEKRAALRAYRDAS
jgi:hypothetical protein